MAARGGEDELGERSVWCAIAGRESHPDTSLLDGRKLFQRHDFVVDAIRLGRERQIVRDDVDISLQASALMATYEGALIQSQLAPEHLRLSGRVSELSELLADWLVRS